MTRWESVAATLSTHCYDKRTDGTVATIRPEAARFANAKMVDVDPARFGAPDERKRLLARWQREIGDSPR